MSPELVGLDEVPDAAGDDNISGDMVLCPECSEPFKKRGLTRHMVQTHGSAPPTRRSSGSEPGRATAKLATQWAEFQRGAALFISFACSQCAAVIVADAQRDGDAIAAFCENRPKLKKQIQQALTGMDVMILVGALGETARKCMAHHDIGRKIGLAGAEQHAHVGGQTAQEKMMSFLTTMPEQDRNLLLNQVFNGMATTSASTSASAPPTATPTVVMDDEVGETPGAPPPPDTSHLTDSDKFQMAMAHSGSTEFETVL